MAIGREDIIPTDVIQLDPEKCEWGPLLAIVSEVLHWGVQCYALLPEKRNESPGQMYMRVKHGDYMYIGRAIWVAAEPEDSSSPESS